MPARHATIAIAATLASVVLLGACGDDDGEATGSAAAPAAAPAPAAAEVTIERSRFEPDELEVAPGTEVTWTNLDLATHTVTSAEGSSLTFDSGELGEGDTFTQSFADAGTYDYFCEVHPTMRSTVVVE